MLITGFVTVTNSPIYQLIEVINYPTVPVHLILIVLFHLIFYKDPVTSAYSHQINLCLHLYLCHLEHNHWNSNPKLCSYFPVFKTNYKKTMAGVITISHFIIHHAYKLYLRKDQIQTQTLSAKP